MEEFLEKLLLELQKEESRLNQDNIRVTLLRSKNPRATQYDQEIAYTSGALGEVFHIRAIIKELMK